MPPTWKNLKVIETLKTGQDPNPRSKVIETALLDAGEMGFDEAITRRRKRGDGTIEVTVEVSLHDLKRMLLT